MILHKNIPVLCYTKILQIKFEKISGASLIIPITVSTTISSRIVKLCIKLRYLRWRMLKLYVNNGTQKYINVVRSKSDDRGRTRTYAG